jgi:hypothetical protein
MSQFPCRTDECLPQVPWRQALGEKRRNHCGVYDIAQCFFAPPWCVDRNKAHFCGFAGDRPKMAWLVQ